MWSNALAYREVNLAPRAQLAELDRIGQRIGGQGPTLITEYQPYGARHFLRDAEPEAVSELRRHPIALRGGGVVHKGHEADTDELALDGLLHYRTLVVRRSPAQSRPPSPYRLIGRGRYYETWQRRGRERDRLSAHMPLGDALDPTGVPRCADVLRLARRAGPGGRVLAARRARPIVVRLRHARHPAAWEDSHFSSRALVPARPGRGRGRDPRPGPRALRVVARGLGPRPASTWPWTGAQRARRATSSTTLACTSASGRLRWRRGATG